MALTVRQLNSGASFLLSFEPIPTDGLTEAVLQEPFRVLLDPRLDEPSTHPSRGHSLTTGCTRLGYVSSLKELPALDVVIVSQASEDHCHERTLKQLSRDGTRQTVLLAEASAAKRIRSWKHFDPAQVQTLQVWQDPRRARRDTAVRIEVPPVWAGGEPGEAAISLICRRRRLGRSSYAVGITYRPPPSPLASPAQHIQFASMSPSIPSIHISAPPPLSLPPVHTGWPSPPPPPPPSSAQDSKPSSSSRPSLRSKLSTASLSPHTIDRAISVIFSPHGMPYAEGGLETYATSHLVAEAALPLTALLHGFDTVSAPWWLPRPGGSTVDALGMPAGLSTASTLAARVWIRADAGGRDTKSPTWKLVRRRRYGKADVQRGLQQAEEASHARRPSRQMLTQTKVLVLRDGDEITLTSDGVFRD